MPSRIPFGTRVLARRGETAGVPPAKGAGWFSRHFAARTVNRPYCCLIVSPLVSKGEAFAIFINRCGSYETANASHLNVTGYLRSLLHRLGISYCGEIKPIIPALDADCIPEVEITS